MPRTGHHGGQPHSWTSTSLPAVPTERRGRRSAAQPCCRWKPTRARAPAPLGGAAGRAAPGGEGPRLGAAVGCSRTGRPGRRGRSAAAAAAERRAAQPRRAGAGCPGVPRARGAAGGDATHGRAPPVPESAPTAHRPETQLPSARSTHAAEAPKLGSVRNPRRAAGAGKPRGDPSVRPTARPSRCRARPAPAGP